MAEPARQGMEPGLRQTLPLDPAPNSRYINIQNDQIYRRSSRSPPPEIAVITSKLVDDRTW